jgi:formate dehydrogenase subunit gamma
MIGKRIREMARCLALALLVVFTFNVSSPDGPDFGPTAAQAQAPTPTPTPKQLPNNVTERLSNIDLWRGIRGGLCGDVSIPDKKAACLVQSAGDEFRAFRNGPMSEYGGWALLAVLIVLVLFFLLRGRIRVDAGLSGRTIERFNAFERFVHWMTASSFVVLALSGLNMLYGKYFLPAIIGKQAFATLTLFGKYSHTWIAWAFMLGIVLMFILWVKDNFPTLTDLQWLMVGGGLLTKGVHPPSKRFNAGQKFIFWSVVLSGGSLAGSGLALLFPFELQMFAGTFKIINGLGFSFPTELTPLQETQYALMWHGIVALVMICIIIGHIYIGSLGMEGAFDAVGTGQVDVNWAKEHHNLWVKDMEEKAGSGASTQAAE